MKIPNLLARALVGVISAVPLYGNEGDVALQNPSFEEGLVGWTVSRSKDEENVQVTEAAATEGAKGLQVKDTDGSPAFSVSSSPVEIQPGAVYQVNFQGFSNGGGGGIGVKMAFYVEGKELDPINVSRYWPAISIKDSQRFTIRSRAPDGANELRVVITSYSAPGAEAMLDDFVITMLEPPEPLVQ